MVHAFLILLSLCLAPQIYAAQTRAAVPTIEVDTDLAASGVQAALGRLGVLNTGRGVYQKNASGSTAWQVVGCIPWGRISWVGVANCIWATSTTAYADFAADTDCNTPTTEGNASAPATKVPTIKFASLPPGYYKVAAYGRHEKRTATYTQLEMFDGTTEKFGPLLYKDAGVTLVVQNLVLGNFAYTTTQTNIEFRVRAKNDAAVSTQIFDDTTADEYSIYVERCADF